MIYKNDMSRRLLDACPSFNAEWQEFAAEWENEPDTPIYLALADFYRHLIAMLERGDTECFPLVFETIERMHVEGDGYVREAATVGLLESLQNTNLHTSTEPEQFRRYLKTVSEKWWDKLYDFWEKGTLLTED